MNVFMFKIIFDNLRSMLRTSQIRPNLPHHFRLVLRTISTYCIGLDILIEKFVRIQLRTVSRKVEQLNSFSIPIHPAFDLSGTMNRMTIYNQKNLLPRGRRFAYKIQILQVLNYLYIFLLNLIGLSDHLKGTI